MASEKPPSTIENSHHDQEIALSKEIKDDDLWIRIKLIVTKIKQSRNRPCYQSIHDQLKRDAQYQDIDKNSDLIPFINQMVSDGHLKNTGREKESFSVITELSSKEAILEVPNPRKRRRMDANLEYDSCCNNNYKHRGLRKTKSMSALPLTQTNDIETDLTVKIDTGSEHEDSVQDVQRKDNLKENVEGNVFLESEDNSLSADHKASDNEKIGDVSTISASSGPKDSIDIHAEIQHGSEHDVEPEVVDILTQEVLNEGAENSFQEKADGDGDVFTISGSSDPNHSSDVLTESQHETELETEPDLIDILTPEVLDDDSSTSFQENNDSSINRTMEQYNMTVLDECAHCKVMENSVKGLVTELQEKMIQSSNY